MCIDDLHSAAGRQDIIYQDMVMTVVGFLTVDRILAGDLGAFRDAVGHLVLPVSILSYFSMAYITHMTRAFMLDTRKGEFMPATLMRAVVIAIGAVMRAVLELVIFPGAMRTMRERLPQNGSAIYVRRCSMPRLSERLGWRS